MGALGIDALTKLKGGGTVEPWVDTGTVLVDKSNAEQYK
jgi:ribose transport system substrate-binding protein